MKIKKKIIKNAIYNKKLNSYKSFAIIFTSNNTNLYNLDRITKSQFLKNNENNFNSLKTIPANVYFYKYNYIEKLKSIKNNIILKKNNQYYTKEQLNFLGVYNNIQKLYNNFTLYKKLYLLLKTISVKN